MRPMINTPLSLFFEKKNKFQLILRIKIYDDYNNNYSSEKPDDKTTH